MTDRTEAVSNVSSAVLVPRIPHVDSTTMLIAQLHGAEIGGPRFNVQCQAAQAQLGSSWLGWGGSRPTLDLHVAAGMCIPSTFTVTVLTVR